MAEQLEDTLEMVVEDTGTGEEGGDVNQREMGALELFTQDA